MNTLPPSNTIIQVDQRIDSRIYSWPATERHPLQWMPMLLGGGMLIQTIGIIGISIFETHARTQWGSLLLAICAFGGIGTFLFWAGYRKRGRETLELRSDSLVYDNGPTILPVTLMWIFSFPLQLHPFFSSSYANPIPSFRRRTWTIFRENSNPLILERVGERQRLRIDCGRERIEIGVYLTEPEREWLAGELEVWQSGTAP